MPIRLRHELPNSFQLTLTYATGHNFVSAVRMVAVQVLSSLLESGSCLRMQEGLVKQDVA